MSRESRSLTSWLAENAPDCGDNSCLFGGKGKGGMRTNGGCRCYKDVRPDMRRIYIERMQAALSENADISLQAKLDKAQQYAGAVCIACSRLGIDFGNLTHEIHAVMREAIANSSVERDGG